ncbi:MAG TPA: hypothetical protein VFE31_15215 [Opitutaceae bacterium]|jgi:hypothetical protein|nr:hypothetical protein [Opitutaceae bacterium]
MNMANTERFRRIERLALAVAGIGLVAALLLGWIRPHAWLPAWRLAAFACLQPALGSLIFILIYRLAGGQWMEGLAPFLLSGVRLLPWVWLAVMPLLLFPAAPPPRDAPARASDVSAGRGAAAALSQTFATSPERSMGAPLRTYFQKPLMAARAAFYACAFFLLAAGARSAMRDRTRTTMRWFGPLGLISLVFMLHLLTTDWIVILEPGWYSTGFPLVWTAAQAISGLAAAICAAIVFGAKPAEKGPTGQPRGIDWGNLLLASVMAWMYVAFVQFLIIWSGDLPGEISWYAHRTRGAWEWIAIALVCVDFGAPFFLLLSRVNKRSRRALGLIAAVLVLGQTGYCAWIIAPAFPNRDAASLALEAALVLAAGAVFLNRYIAGARGAALAQP